MTEPTGSTAERSATASARWQTAIIEEIEPLTPTVKRVLLRPAQWRPFLPGQHIDVQLTASDGYTAQRSYSLTSAPGSVSTFEIVVERLDDGEVSPYFHDVARAGDAIEISGPHAEHFVWRATAQASSGAYAHAWLLMAAGGSGVAPFLSMVRHRASVSNPAPATLLYSARTWESVICRAELLAQEAAQPALRCVLALTRDQTRRVQDFGRRIDAPMLAAIVNARVLPSETFVCGANGFVRTVSDLLVDLGVPARTILTERYGGA